MKHTGLQEEEKQQNIYLSWRNNRKKDTIVKMIIHRKDHNNTNQSSAKCIVKKS
jgi:hypothetical protein